MKVLVTGGVGFIGGHLVDRLIDLGHEVVIIDNLSRGKKENANPKAKLVIGGVGELSRGDLVAEETGGDFDIVFHLAAWARVQQSFTDPLGYHENNVSQMMGLLEWARTHAKRFVFASSSSVYGDQPVPTFGLNEDDTKTKPGSPYATQKLIGEELCRLYTRAYGLKTVCARFFNVYGPRMASEGAYVTVIKRFLMQKAEGKPLTVRGKGAQSRDFTHVTDLVDGLVLFTEAFTENEDVIFDGRAINFGGGKPVSVNRLAEIIGGKGYPRENVEAVKEPFETRADTSKSFANLGWKPRIDIEAGIKELL